MSRENGTTMKTSEESAELPVDPEHALAAGKYPCRSCRYMSLMPPGVGGDCSDDCVFWKQWIEMEKVRKRAYLEMGIGEKERA